MKRWYLLLAAIALVFLCIGQAGAVIMNSSFPALYITGNGTTIIDSSLNAATIESLDTTTGDVVIHYTMEYVPEYPDILVQLVANSTGKVIWEGDAHELDGYWRFNLKDSYFPQDAPKLFPAGYTARLYKNEVGI